MAATAGDFSPTPSFPPAGRPVVVAAASVPAEATAVGYLVGTNGPIPAGLDITREALVAVGFTGVPGTACVLPGLDARIRVAVGIGDASTADAADYRSAGASFARAAATHRRLAIEVPSADGRGPRRRGRAPRPLPLRRPAQRAHRHAA